MTCCRCHAEMEPVPGVGWICPSCLTEGQGRGSIRITIGPEGMNIDAGGMTSIAVINVLRCALAAVVAGHVEASRRAGQTN